MNDDEIDPRSFGDVVAVIAKLSAVDGVGNLTFIDALESIPPAYLKPTVLDLAAKLGEMRRPEAFHRLSMLIAQCGDTSEPLFKVMRGYLETTFPWKLRTLKETLTLLNTEWQLSIKEGDPIYERLFSSTSSGRKKVITECSEVFLQHNQLGNETAYVYVNFLIYLWLYDEESAIRAAAAQALLPVSKLFGAQISLFLPTAPEDYFEGLLGLNERGCELLREDAKAALNRIKDKYDEKIQSMIDKL